MNIIFGSKSLLITAQGQTIEINIFITKLKL